jgi:inorganic pyrophosphatase
VHPWHDIDPGPYPPVNWMAVIEIPRGSNIKYELDKQSGLLRVDRVLHSAVFYHQWDHKIVSVATGDPEYRSLQTVHQLPEYRLAALRRFFLDYQVLEGKTVEVEDFEAAEKAQEVIVAARQRYQRGHSPCRRRGREAASVDER